MKRFGITIFLLIAFMIGIWGCGSKIQKETLGADEYFEYALQKFKEGDYFEAATDFTIIVLKFGGNPIVDDAQYYLAESHFMMKEYLIAVSEYEKLINDYPESPFVVDSKFKIGLSYYRMSLRPELDQEYTYKAYRQFQLFIEEFPTHDLRQQADEYLVKLREKLAQKKLIAATTYRKMGVLRSAIIYYDIILQEFYDTQAAAEAQYWKGECLYQLKEWSEALSAFTAFVQKYPTHKLVKKAKERISDLMEKVKTSPKKEEALTNESQ